MYAETATEKLAMLNNILASKLGVDDDPFVVSVRAEAIFEWDFAAGSSEG